MSHIFLREKALGKCRFALVGCAISNLRMFLDFVVFLHIFIDFDVFPMYFCIFDDLYFTAMNQPRVQWSILTLVSTLLGGCF